jgi:hypothetical protein
VLSALDAATAVAATVPWPQLVAGSIITALVGVVAFGVRALIRGDLVPRKVLQDTEERADKWEAAWDASQQTIKDFGGRIDAVTEGLRTIERALTSVTSQIPRERA